MSYSPNGDQVIQEVQPLYFSWSESLPLRNRNQWFLQMRLRILYLLIYCSVGLHTVAQQFPVSAFTRYTTADGLSSNSVTGLAQDSTGYMWIATFLGLNRFDGSRFVQYHSTDDSLSLATEELTDLTWLDNRYLAAFPNGLHIVDTKTGSTRNLYIPFPLQQYLYKFNTVEAARGDDKGNIIVLTRSGLYHFNKDRLVWRFDYYDERDLSHQHFHFGSELVQLDPDRYLVVSESGLLVYHSGKKQLKKLEAADCPPLALFLDYPRAGYLFFQVKPGRLLALKQGIDSIFYVNTTDRKIYSGRLPHQSVGNDFGWRSRLIPANDTLFYLTGHFSGFHQFRIDTRSGTVVVDTEKQFAAFLCTSILKDRDNLLWVGTNKGLFRQNPGRSQVETASLPAFITDSFPNIRFSSISSTEDKIFAGTRGDAGLMIFNKKTLRFEEQLLFEQGKSASNQVYVMTPAGPSSLLVGTNGQLYLVNQQSKKIKKVIPPGWAPGNWTNDLFKDKDGIIWIAGSSNIYQYQPSTGIAAPVHITGRSLTIPVHITQDRKGNIWMASHGLARFNKSLGQFDIFVDSFPYIKMPDKQIDALVVDHENTIWFNSPNNGLIAYNPDRNSFRHFTTRNGLPDNNVVALLVVDKKLWIATFSGLACLDPATSSLVSFGREDGLPDLPATRGSDFYYDSKSAQLYLGFASTLVRFRPDDLLHKKTPPKLFVESFATAGQHAMFLPPDHVNLSWRESEMSFTIGSINFSDAGSQRFAYRIVKDPSTSWTDLGTQPSFSISRLPPGNHLVQVKAYSLTNRWPEQVKEIEIEIKPPLWKQDWFITIMVLLSLVLLYSFIRWRTATARKKEMEKTQVEKLKADYYKDQYEMEQITNYFSSSLSGKKNAEEVLWDVAANLIGRMNYEDCIIYLWNKDRTRMVQKAAWGPKGKPELISADGFEVAPGQGIVGHVIETRQPLLVNDTRKDERYRVDDEFRLSEVAVPIIHNDELLGVIDSEHSVPGYFSERDIKILTTIATLTGNKIKQMESERSLEAKQKELAGINEQLAEARLSALQAQMNPHFVFNALNSIKRMILDGDNEKASRYLSKFALMIRMTLEHSKEVFVTLDENIEYLKAYLEMEQLRFDVSFGYSICIDDSVDTSDTSIPSMMIQPLVENAIWHGLMQSEGRKHIQIDFCHEGNKVICTVEDNGIGIRRSEKLKETQRPLHRSVGLENLRKRIRIMNEKYDTNCSLQIIDLSEKGINESGTRAILQFNQITTHQKI